MTVANSTEVFIDALVPIIAYLLAKDPEDYTYAIRNSEDCWYPPTCAIMTDLIPRLTAHDLEYSKATALADSTAAVDSIFQDFKDTALAKVYFPQCIANGYNATTAQLLANAAYAKTVSTAAQLKLDQVTKYAGIRVNDLQVMSQLIGAIRNSKTVGDIYRGAQQDINWVSGAAKLATAIFNDTTKNDSEADKDPA